MKSKERSLVQTVAPKTTSSGTQTDTLGVSRRVADAESPQRMREGPERAVLAFIKGTFLSRKATRGSET